MRIAPYEISQLVYIRAITPIHVGAGRGERVDLPVERDGFGLPTIPASGIKGAIRERFPDHYKTLLFGSKSAAGCFTPLDGILVAMPARSLRGVWMLITSPLSLRRLRTYAELSGQKQMSGDFLSMKLPEENEIIIGQDGESKFGINGKILLNEEYLLSIRRDDLSQLAKYLNLPEPDRLGLVDDTVFKQIVNTSLLTRARVRLESKTKTVETGGLWTEEDVPAEARFITCFLYAPSREEQKTAEEIQKIVEKTVFADGGGYLILGGHETVGRGLVKLEKVV